MQIQYTPYILAPLAASLILGWITYYSWTRRTTRVARWLALLSLAITIWQVGYAFELAGTDLPTKLFWVRIEYLGIATVPLIWLIFALHYSNLHKLLSLPRSILLSLVPAITLFLVFTTQSNGPIWKEISLDKVNNFWEWHATYGPWFTVHIAYTYLLLLAGSFLILRSLAQFKNLYRGQAYALLIAVLAPWVGNGLYLLGVSPRGLDITPFVFTISALAITWGIFGAQLLEILPIARSTIIEEMGEGVIVLDMENHIIDINPSALRMLGISSSRPVGQKITDHLGKWGYLAEKHIGAMKAVDEITLGEGESQQWFEFRLSALRDKQTKVVGKVVTITSITDRKQTELLLLASEARYRQIVESASDVIYRTDAQGRFTYANPTTLNLMGYKSESDVVGKHYLELIAPRYRHDLKRYYDQQYTAKETNTYHEFIAVTTKGDEIWLGQNVQTIKEGDQIVGFQAVARNITDLKRAQDELALARDQAVEANQFKSLMLAKVSHELRTPLGGILGFAELLHSAAFGALTDNQKNAVAQVIDSTHYLTKMINDLLDEAHIESNTIRLYSDLFAPAKLLHEIETSMAILADQKGLTLITSIASDLPEFLYGDEQRLRQILVNLVSNAIKFTKKGEIRVGLSSPDPAHWSLQVSDTGAGIPEEARAYIFEPFRQVDNEITHTNQGTGLGLSICKQLVELMEGQINFESKVEQGSTFTVILPLKKNSENIS